MMKLFAIQLVMMLVRPLELENIDQEYLSFDEVEAINRMLRGDSIFDELEQIFVMHQGHDHVDLYVKKETQRKPQHFLVRITEDNTIIDYPVGKEEDAFYTGNIFLNEIISDTKIPNLLVQKDIPFVPLLITFRYLLYEDTARLGTPIVRVVALYELPGESIEREGKGLRDDTSKLGKAKQVEFLTDLLYKILLLSKEVNDAGWLNLSFKPFTGVNRDVMIGAGLFGESFSFPYFQQWTHAFNFKEAEIIYDDYIDNGIFTPPEYYHFKEHFDNTIIAGAFGYSYSGSEDIYSIGMLAIYFADQFARIKEREINSHLDDESNIKFTAKHWLVNEKIEEKIAKLIFPVTLEQASSIVRLGNVHGMTILKEVGKAMQDKEDRKKLSELEHLDEVQFPLEKNTLNTAALKIIDMIIAVEHGLDEQVEFLKEEKAKYPKKDTGFLGDYYSLLKDNFHYHDVEIEDRRKFMEAELGDSEEKMAIYDAFFASEKKLLKWNPFQKILEGRMGYDEAVESFGKILYDIEEDKLKNLINDHRVMLSDYGRRRKALVDFNRSTLIVDPTFYDVFIEDMKEVYQDYDILYQGKDVKSDEGTTFTIPSDYVTEYHTKNYFNTLIAEINKFVEADASNKVQPFNRAVLPDLIGRKLKLDNTTDGVKKTKKARNVDGVILDSGWKLGMPGMIRQDLI